MNVPQHSRRAPSSSQLMNVPALPQLQENKAYIRSFNQTPPNNYPFSYIPPPPNSTAIVPLNQVAETPTNPAITDKTAKKNSFSIKEIKQAIDRMGGLDGIVETMGKVQKVMQSISQIAPMAKLLVGSLLPGQKTNEQGQDTQNVKKEEDCSKMSCKRRRRKHPTEKIRKAYSNKRRPRSDTVRRH